MTALSKRPTRASPARGVQADTATWLLSDRTRAAEREKNTAWAEGRLTEMPIGAKKNLMSKSKKPTPSDVLRKAIAESGLTLYRIAKDTGVIKTSLMRFMAGETSLRLDKADVLAEYLGLELVKKRKVRP